MLKTFTIISLPMANADHTATQNFLTTQCEVDFGNANRPCDWSVCHSGNGDDATIVFDDFQGAWSIVSALNGGDDAGVLVFTDIPWSFLEKYRNGFKLTQNNLNLFFRPVDCFYPHEKQLSTTYGSYGPWYRRFLKVNTENNPHANLEDDVPLLDSVVETAQDVVGKIYWNPVAVQKPVEQWQDLLGQRNFLSSEPVCVLPPWQFSPAEACSYFLSDNLDVRRAFRATMNNGEYAQGVINQDAEIQEPPQQVPPFPDYMAFRLWEAADDPLFRDTMISGGELDTNVTLMENKREGNDGSLRNRMVSVLPKELLKTKIVFRPGGQVETLQEYASKFFEEKTSSFSDTGKSIALACQADLLTMLGGKNNAEIDVSRTCTFVFAQPPPRDGIDDPADQLYGHLESLATRLMRHATFREIYENDTRPNRVISKFVAKFWAATSQTHADTTFWTNTLFIHYGLLAKEFAENARSLKDRLKQSDGFPMLWSDKNTPCVYMGNTTSASDWLSVALLFPVGTTLIASGPSTLDNSESYLNSNLVLN